MGILDAILGKGKDEGPIELDEYLEGEGDVVTPPAKFYVKKIDLRNEGDASVVMKEIDSENIVIVNILPLSKQPKKLKNLIDKMKHYASKIDGDIAKITNDLILITPKRVKIAKTKKR